MVGTLTHRVFCARGPFDDDLLNRHPNNDCYIAVNNLSLKVRQMCTNLLGLVKTSS